MQYPIPLLKQLSEEPRTYEVGSNSNTSNFQTGGDTLETQRPTNYLTCVILWSLLCSPRKMLEYYLKLSYNYSLPYLFQYIIHCYPMM